MSGACAGWRPLVPGSGRVPAGRPPVPGPGRGLVGVPGCPAWVVRRSASSGVRPWSYVGWRPPVLGPGASVGIAGALCGGGPGPVSSGGRCLDRVPDGVLRCPAPGSCLGRRSCRVLSGGGPGAGVLGWPMPGSCAGWRPPVPGSRIVPRSAALPGVHRWRARGRCPRAADARIVAVPASADARIGRRTASPVPGPGRAPDGVPRCPVPVVPRTASPPGVHPRWAISPRPWWWRRSTGVRCTAMRAASSPSRPPTWASRSRRRWCISASGLSSVHRATRSASG